LPQHSQAARDEAYKRYHDDVSDETGASIDDYGYSETARSAFLAGVQWQAERVRALSQKRDRLWLKVNDLVAAGPDNMEEYRATWAEWIAASNALDEAQRG
jgi:hypothetical protein